MTKDPLIGRLVDARYAIVDRVARGGMATIYFELSDQWLEPGEIKLTTRTLRAIATPGHTRGHLVFLDEQAGLLFSGDHVLPHITPSIGRSKR